MNEALTMSGDEYGAALKARLSVLGDVMVAEAALNGMQYLFAAGDLASAKERVERAEGSVANMASIAREWDIEDLILQSDFAASNILSLRGYMDRGDVNGAWERLGDCKANVSACYLAICRWLDIECANCYRVLVRGGMGVEEVRPLGRDNAGGVYCVHCVRDGRVEQFNAIAGNECDQAANAAD